MYVYFIIMEIVLLFLGKETNWKFDENDAPTKCWSPWFPYLYAAGYLLMLYILYQNTEKQSQSGTTSFLVFFIAHVIAMSSTIYNPFLYAWMNENFKKEFKQVIPCLFRSRRHSSMNGLTTQYTTVDTQSVMIPQNRSPVPKEKNANNINWGKDAKACYDNASETVHLKVAENENAEEDWRLHFINVNT